MPQEAQNYQNPSQDGRRKILTTQYPEIIAKYRALKSMRAVARLYNVDKRLIQFIVYPERLAQLKKHNKQIKHYKKYYNTETRKLSMRKYRAKKRATGLMIIKTAPRKYK